MEWPMGGVCTGRRSDARLATFLAVRRPSIVVSDDGKPARAALGTLLTVEEVSLALRASQVLRSRSHEFRVLGFWDSARKKFVHGKVFRKRCKASVLVYCSKVGCHCPRSRVATRTRKRWHQRDRHEPGSGHGVRTSHGAENAVIPCLSASI